MPLEDEDFILRQVKQMAQGLGQFLSKEDVKEILQMEDEQGELKKKDEKPRPENDCTKNDLIYARDKR